MKWMHSESSGTKIKKWKNRRPVKKTQKNKKKPQTNKAQSPHTKAKQKDPKCVLSVMWRPDFQAFTVDDN